MFSLNAASALIKTKNVINRQGLVFAIVLFTGCCDAKSQRGVILQIDKGCTNVQKIDHFNFEEFDITFGDSSNARAALKGSAKFAVYPYPEKDDQNFLVVTSKTPFTMKEISFDIVGAHPTGCVVTLNNHVMKTEKDLPKYSFDKDADFEVDALPSIRGTCGEGSTSKNEIKNAKSVYVTWKPILNDYVIVSNFVMHVCFDTSACSKISEYTQHATFEFGDDDFFNLTIPKYRGATTPALRGSGRSITLSSEQTTFSVAGKGNIRQFVVLDASYGLTALLQDSDKSNNGAMRAGYSYGVNQMLRQLDNIQAVSSWVVKLPTSAFGHRLEMVVMHACVKPIGSLGSPANKKKAK